MISKLSIIVEAQFRIHVSQLSSFSPFNSLIWNGSFFFAFSYKMTANKRKITLEQKMHSFTVRSQKYLGHGRSIFIFFSNKNEQITKLE
jgi:hypothetical protein